MIDLKDDREDFLVRRVNADKVLRARPPRWQGRTG
jgi:hypothetical protein